MEDKEASLFDCIRENNLRVNFYIKVINNFKEEKTYRN